MPKQKIQTIGHYWRLKRDQEIWKSEICKMADELKRVECEWERASFNGNRPKLATRSRELGLDLARLQGKLMKLTHALGIFDGSIKEIPIITEGGGDR